MKELLINQVAPVAATAVVAILVAIIKSVGDVAIDVLKKKKEEIEQKIKASGHESELKQAKEVWDIIEEKFRITENSKQVLGSKADMFNQLLLERIPGLTQQNIIDLRQAIAGEFNKGKEALTSDSSAQQIINLQKLNEDLKTENQTLKSALNKISSAIPQVTEQA
jgi:hypothetical protein